MTKEQLTFAIGDIDSVEKGSAARACDGKPDWSLMPLHQIAYILGHECPCTVTTATLTNQLGWFQARGEWLDARKFLTMSVRLLQQEMDAPLNQAMWEVIAVWEHGREKYDAFNWMKGMAWSQVVASAQRHIMSLAGGTKIDEESNRYHAAHIVCNAMMLCHYVDHYKEGNDLPTQWF